MAYVLRGRKGGTVRFIPLENGVIEKESESYSSSVTSNPVEDGADIDDHGDAAINALKSMRDRRDVITYIGVTRMSNLVFTSLKFDRSYKNRHGASFSATLKQVQMTSSEFVPMDAELAMTSQDAGKSQNPQLARTVSTGMAILAIQSVSSTAAAALRSVNVSGGSAAPLTRLTGGYDGLARR